MYKYFLYARKSTDEEDRQVMSIDSQLTELLEFSKKESLHIVERFIESKTAKVPGRPIFNAMVAKLEKGEADGILAWHPDRLARNSVDGGHLIYLLDMNKLQSLKFPTVWFDNTPQGKFMLNIAFGQSKYYVDNLRENILRGIRQKLRRGEFPGYAPIGYLNELKTHTIVPDPQTAPTIKKLFETYADGIHSIYAISDLAGSWGLRSRYGNKVWPSQIIRMLSNPFYIGLMRVNGELHEATHEPLIPKALFDQVQSVLRSHARPRKPNKQPEKRFVFSGLLTCGECRCAITAEKQKGHNYYRCTKKRGICSQRYIREEALAAQLRAILDKIGLPKEWKAPMFAQLETWKCEELQVSQTSRANLENQRTAVTDKLNRLLDAHLEGIVSRDEYVSRKETFLLEKVETETRLASLATKGSVWLEPARAFLETAFEAVEAASGENFEKIFLFFKKAGSNPTLAHQIVKVELKNPWPILVDFHRNSGWLWR